LPGQRLRAVEPGADEQRRQPGRPGQRAGRGAPAEFRPPGNVLRQRRVRRQSQYRRAPPPYRQPDLTVHIGHVGDAGLGEQPGEPGRVEVGRDDGVAVGVDEREVQYLHRVASATASGSASANSSCSASRTAQKASSNGSPSASGSRSSARSAATASGTLCGSRGGWSASGSRAGSSGTSSGSRNPASTAAAATAVTAPA